MRAEATTPEGPSTTPPPLSTLLSQVLLAYTLEFEQRSAISLPLHANVLRVLEATSVDVRELPRLAAVSPEAIAMALTFLTKNGLVSVDRRAKVAHLTPEGVDARESAQTTHAAVLRDWEARLGGDVERLRAAVAAIVEQRDGASLRLAHGLRPHPEGWRASGPYAARTQAMLDDPPSGLPAYPMVLHRGGWPDGS